MLIEMRARAVIALVAGVFVAAIVCYGPRPASAKEPMRIVVWVAPDTDWPVVDRIRGQLSDLDVEMTTVDAPGPGAALRAQIEAAERLAQERGVRVVLWFDSATVSDQLIVYLCTPGSGRVLVRKLGSRTRTDKGPTSATLEAAAIVVHGGVEALAAGATIGFTKEEVLAESAPPPQRSSPPAPPPAPEVAVPRRSEEGRPLRSSRSRWTLTATIGWQVEAIAPTLADQGPLAGLRLGVGGWSVGIGASTSLGATLIDPRAHVRIQRPAGFARLGREWRIAEQASLDTGVCLGALAFIRNTSDTAPGVTPTASDVNASPFVGPEVSLMLAPAALPLRVKVTFGLDIVASPIVVGYDAGGTFVQDEGTWPVQPRLGLELDWVSHL
jgi:hypothetical protein